MENTETVGREKELSERRLRTKGFLKKIKDQKVLIMMVLPLVIWLFIFGYIPLGGWLMAFQDYKPALGIFGSSFVGFKHFIALFQDDLFYRALINTLGMGSLGIIFGTLTSIAFALLLNELRFTRFKKFTQTVSYLPHFVSWVIVANIVTTMLSTSGIVNQVLQGLHIISTPIQFMSDPSKFWFIVTFSDVWKEMGWSAIIYLAAMVSIDREMYEAAEIDGATRWQKMLKITLPSIKPIIMVLLIMNIGNLINIGFEKQMLLGNNIVADAALVLDKYALDYGIGMFRYSYGTAIGIFKSVVSVVLIFTFNRVAKKMGEGQIM